MGKAEKLARASNDRPGESLGTEPHASTARPAAAVQGPAKLGQGVTRVEATPPSSRWAGSSATRTSRARSSTRSRLERSPSRSRPAASSSRSACDGTKSRGPT